MQRHSQAPHLRAWHPGARWCDWVLTEAAWAQQSQRCPSASQRRPPRSPRSPLRIKGERQVSKAFSACISQSNYTDPASPVKGLKVSTSNVCLPILARSTLSSGQMWYSCRLLLSSNILLVMASGAGPGPETSRCWEQTCKEITNREVTSGLSPPLEMLYLIPKSPLGPPGLWLAVRMMPPTAFILRITQETAGVDMMPSWPITRCPIWRREHRHAVKQQGRGSFSHLVPRTDAIIITVGS